MDDININELRARAFEEAANEMDRLVAVMEQEQERVIRTRMAGTFDWPGSYIADREGHAVWLRRWAAMERAKSVVDDNKQAYEREIYDPDLKITKAKGLFCNCGMRITEIDKPPGRILSIDVNSQCPVHVPMLERLDELGMIDKDSKDG